MRTTRILFSILFVGISSILFAQTPTIPSLSKTNGVKTVLVSKNLLSMAGGRGNNVFDLTPKIYDKLDALEVYTERITATHKGVIEEEFDKYVANKKSLISLMQITGDNHRISIYGESADGGKIYTKVLMLTIKNHKCSMTIFIGSMTPADIQQWSISNFGG